MKAKINSIMRKTAKKTGKPFWVVYTSEGQYTAFQELSAGKVYEFDVKVSEDGVYKSMTNIAESYDEKKELWFVEREGYIRRQQQDADEIKLLKEQITFLKDLVKK